MSRFDSKHIDRSTMLATLAAETARDEASPSEHVPELAQNATGDGGSGLRRLHARLSRVPLLAPLIDWAVALLRIGPTRRSNNIRLQQLEAQSQQLETRLQAFEVETRAQVQAFDEVIAAEKRSTENQFKRLISGQDRLSSDGENAKTRAAAETQATSARLAALAGNLDLVSRYGFAGAPRTPLEAKPKRSALLDDFYVALEQRHRGSMEDIAARQTIYIAEIETMMRAEALAGPVLDLGCGRGEWLDLLKAKNVEAIGVDTNSGQLAEARAKGLAVVEDDGLTFMAGQPEASFMAVTAFHLVEHLPFEMLAAWFVEIRRILKPGGRLIIETPNPENLIVGAFTFHMDPTHQKPLPSGLLDVLGETVGFEKADIRPLHPHPRLGESLKELPSEVAYLLYGYQDYAFLARKPSAGTV